MPAPTLAAVGGRCLGGGLELVLACDLVLVHPDAELGLPEIKLAVFPPAGLALLPARVGGGDAADLALSGRSWSGRRAFERGLAQRIVTDSLADDLDEWLAHDFVPRSAAALRHASLAGRWPVRRALLQLPRLCATYLDDLMREPDAIEGIDSFLAKRSPQWGDSGNRT